MAIILLPNCTMLYYVFSGPLSLRAYVPEIKFNNNNTYECGKKECLCGGCAGEEEERRLKRRWMMSSINCEREWIIGRRGA